MLGCLHFDPRRKNPLNELHLQAQEGHRFIPFVYHCFLNRMSIGTFVDTRFRLLAVSESEMINECTGACGPAILIALSIILAQEISVWIVQGMLVGGLFVIGRIWKIPLSYLILLSPIYLWFAWNRMPNEFAQFLPKIFPIFLVSAIVIQVIGFTLRIASQRLTKKNTLFSA